MRPILLLLLLPLASCGGDRERSFSAQSPGLDVADVALASGEPDTALRIARNVLTTDPRNVPALVQAAKAQAALGQREQAKHGFNQALALAPNDADAALGLGRLELNSDPKAAAAVLLRLAERDPHNVAALIDLGIARDLLGQHGEAQQAYRLALVLEPESLAGQVNLGLSLALSGDPRHALEILRPAAHRAEASPRTRQDLAVALALAGDDDEAASMLRTDIPRPEVLATIAGYHLLQSAP